MFGMSLTGDLKHFLGFISLCSNLLHGGCLCVLQLAWESHEVKLMRCSRMWDTVGLEANSSICVHFSSLLSRANSTICVHFSSLLSRVRQLWLHKWDFPYIGVITLSCRSASCFSRFGCLLRVLRCVSEMVRQNWLWNSIDKISATSSVCVTALSCEYVYVSSKSSAQCSVDRWVTARSDDWRLAILTTANYDIIF